MYNLGWEPWSDIRHRLIKFNQLMSSIFVETSEVVHPECALLIIEPCGAGTPSNIFCPIFAGSWQTRQRTDIS
jgi:hypothetical protein